MTPCGAGEKKGREAKALKKVHTLRPLLEERQTAA